MADRHETERARRNRAYRNIHSPAAAPASQEGDGLPEDAADRIEDEACVVFQNSGLVGGLRVAIRHAAEVAYAAGLAAGEARERAAVEVGDVEYGCLNDPPHSDDERAIAWTISADAPLARQMVEDENAGDLVWRVVSDWQPWPPPTVEPTIRVDAGFAEAVRVLSEYAKSPNAHVAPKAALMHLRALVAQPDREAGDHLDG